MAERGQALGGMLLGELLFFKNNIVKADIGDFVEWVGVRGIWSLILDSASLHRGYIGWVNLGGG